MNPYFIIDFGCPQTFETVVIRNGHLYGKCPIQYFYIDVLKSPDPEEISNDFTYFIPKDDTRFNPESPPLEYLKLYEAKIDVQFAKIWPYYDYECIYGSLDYFDIVRNKSVQIMEDAKLECVPKTTECDPVPQYCPSSDCISHTVEWEDINFPNLIQKGCSVHHDGVLFQNSAKCVLKSALEDKMPPYR